MKITIVRRIELPGMERLFAEFLKQQLSQTISINRKFEQIMDVLQKVLDAVNAENAVIDKAKALLNTLLEEVKNLQPTQEAIDNLAASIQAKTQELADAVAAGTPPSSGDAGSGNAAGSQPSSNQG